MLICICGLPGSGKTFFAKYLAKHLKIERFSSDEIRGEMQQLGQYDEDSRLAIYVEMAKRAKPLLLNGQRVILDASFNTKAQRQIMLNLAKTHNIPIAFIRTYADEKTSLARVSQNRDFTEADTRVYYLLKGLWEELNLPHLNLNSSQQSLEERLELAVAYLKDVNVKDTNEKFKQARL